MLVSLLRLTASRGQPNNLPGLVAEHVTDQSQALRSCPKELTILIQIRAKIVATSLGVLAEFICGLVMQNGLGMR